MSVRWFLVSMLPASVLSPMQDHVRRMLHLSGRSSRAAGVSLAQLSVVLICLVAVLALGVRSTWIPFGVLSMANMTSLTLGYYFARRGKASFPQPIRLLQVVSMGRTLVFAGIASPLAALLVATIVSRLAGSETLGLWEAARIAAQPVFVLSVGLNAALGPRSMEAASLRDIVRAKKLRRMFAAGVLAVGSLYLLIVAFAVPWNPLLPLVPNAYRLNGLVALGVAAVSTMGFSFPLNSEMLGGRQLRKLAIIEAVGNSLRTCVAALVGVLSAFAVPLGLIALAGVRWIGFRRSLDSFYTQQSS